ncbi:MAG: hypothetical protein B6D61_12825 [Bacteroidetes bacterium 4484_249]|nr:MAG: hypothetical protein B6D61_12825 [Bacteroidetes bacterium 4484_249]
MKKKILFVLLILWFISLNHCYSQDSVQLPADYKRNVIKWNVTPFLLWSYRNINLSYERVLKPNRTFSVNAGYFELPSTGIFDSLSIENTTKKSGFSLSGDYRFYFKKRNINPAPDGLYWGVYASYHHYQFHNSITVVNSPTVQGALDLDAKLNILSLGAELGYQFVIKKRFTLDLIFIGPSFSMYNFQIGLQGDLAVDKDDEYLQGVADVLYGLFPGLDRLVDERLVDENGVSTSFGFGFRYMLQIGYRF